MSDPHLSRGIPVFLAVILFLAVGSCTTTNTTQTPLSSQPPLSPQPSPPQVGVATEPPARGDVQFASRGEEVSHEIEQYQREIRCTRGNDSKGAPIICVDNATTRPNPYAARAWDVEGIGGNPTNTPVVVHWFTRRTANLQITFREQNCVENLVCDGRGHCRATVKRLAPGERLRTCRYTVSIDGRVVDTKSPEFGVVPCCW